MGTRENKIETYLNAQVELINGITRKWVSPGHDGVPDRIIILEGVVFFCEVKTDNGILSSAQEREHHRLRENGATVCTVYGHGGVDKLINDLNLYGRPLIKSYGGWET